LFAFRTHPVYKLIVAANRDESYLRPTAPVHFWEDHPEIFAGRDLEKMGTWMGINVSGHFAALTNYRDPNEITAGKRSRGEIVAGALKYKGNIMDYMIHLKESHHLYPGYNLLSGNGDELYYYSNIEQELKKLEPGIYGVSNHLLNTDWPKVQIGKEGLTKIMNEQEDEMVPRLFQLLHQTDPAPDEFLPKTGVSLEWERILSPLFINSKNYGTRSSTVLLMNDKNIHIVERAFSGGQIIDRKNTITLS
jgi:uncharacterized protein with NRDE domain